MPLYRSYGVSSAITIVTAATVSALTVILLKWYAKQKNRIPQKWKPVGKVSNIFLYPLKSGRRIELESAECTLLGLQQIGEPGKYPLRDRSIVVYKESSKECRTGRTNPKLVLVEVSINDEDCLILNAPGMETLLLDIHKILDKSRSDLRKEDVTFFLDEKFRITDCGEDAAKWITNYLNPDGTSSSRIGLHDGLYRRTMTQPLKEFANAYPNVTLSTMGIYSDLTSYLLINHASVRELAERIPDTTISVNNFRPNIVVSDNNLSPFEEDQWEWVKVGDVIFKSVKACTRCILTTVDPESGTRNTNMEPLKTLKSYRIIKDLINSDLEKDSPVMGLHMGWATNGIIHIGDTVSVPSDELA